MGRKQYASMFTIKIQKYKLKKTRQRKKEMNKERKGQDFYPVQLGQVSGCSATAHMDLRRGPKHLSDHLKSSASTGSCRSRSLPHSLNMLPSPVSCPGKQEEMEKTCSKNIRFGLRWIFLPIQHVQHFECRSK